MPECQFWLAIVKSSEKSKVQEFRDKMDGNVNHWPPSREISYRCDVGSSSTLFVRRNCSRYTLMDMSVTCALFFCTARLDISKLRCNEELTNLVFTVRKVSDAKPYFAVRIYDPTVRSLWAINQAV